MNESDEKLRAPDELIRENFRAYQSNKQQE